MSDVQAARPEGVSTTGTVSLPGFTTRRSDDDFPSIGEADGQHDFDLPIALFLDVATDQRELLCAAWQMRSRRVSLIASADHPRFEKLAPGAASVQDHLDAGDCSPCTCPCR